jgi:hypothetical protein
MRSPSPLMCVGCSALFPTIQALCAHLNSPGLRCTFAPDNYPVVDADRHCLAPCTFCGRYFRSGGLSRHQHSCIHRNTTPFQPAACGVSLPRGRPPPVHPRSLTPWVPSNDALTMGPLVVITAKSSSSPTSKVFFESYRLSFRSGTSSNGVPPSVVRLVKPVFEELIGCVLSFRGRATQGLPRKRLGRNCFYSRAWVCAP